MNYKDLIKRLQSETYWLGSGQTYSRDVHPVICDEAVTAITDLLARAEAAEARAENAERKLDAAMLELDEVSAAVDNLDEFIDEQIHPLVSYDMYTALRDNADYISIWRHEVKWRGKVENVT